MLFIDVITIEKSGDQFRLLYDTKGRFVLHRINDEEKKFKLCKVTKRMITKKGVPAIVTHDGRTIRYPDPLIKINDTIKLDLESGKPTEFVKFENGNLCTVTKGRNTGRVGIIVSQERYILILSLSFSFISFISLLSMSLS